MAAPVTEPVVLRVASGPKFLTDLRAALDSAPKAARFLLGEGELPASALESDEPVVAVGQAVADTCKEVVDGRVRRTVPRDSLVNLRGPWLISRQALAEALARAAGLAPPQDLVGLCRLAGLRIRVVRSE